MRRDMTPRHPAALSLFLVLAMTACGGSENTTPSRTGGTGGSTRTGGAGGAVTGGAGGGVVVTGGTGGGLAGAGGAIGGAGGVITGGTGGAVGGAGGAIGGAGGAGGAGDTAVETSTLEVSTETAPADVGACTAGGKCTLAGGKNGICVAGVCTACVDTASDAACVAAYGANHLCIAGGCLPATCRDSRGCTAGQICDSNTRTCTTCTTDAACRADATAYGAGFICLAGKCEKGDCHDTSLECTAGFICGVSKPHTCGPCTASTQCTGDAGRYGAGFVCSDAGKCAKGDCGGSSSDCTGGREGQICGVSVPNTCGSCTQDSQCRNDPRYKDAKPMCWTATGPDSGRCVTNACTNVGQKCTGNGADFCCGNKCVPGNCCDGDDTPCKVIGAAYTCVKNTCTTCDAPAGNQYVVDPVNGNDTVATGSGKAGGVASNNCAFKTLTRALEALPDTAAVGTTITVLGASGKTTELVVTGTGAERFPIDIPANVKVTSSGGPVLVRLPAAKIGFRLLGKSASLGGPSTGNEITIDGGGTSATAVIANVPGTDAASVANLKIKKTADDGLRVLGGTLAIGPVLEVSEAGTASAKQSGLDITGGVAVLASSSGRIALWKNSEHGIKVTSRGEVDIAGTPSGTAGAGNGSVLVAENGDAGLHIAQDIAFGARKVSDVSGLVAHANQGPGLRVQGGSKVKLRGSVLLANGGSGVLLEPAAASVAGNDVSGIDLGVSGDPGKNIVQALLGSNPNTGAGLCVDLSAAAGTATVRARGNLFAGTASVLDCSAATPSGKIAIADNCGRVNVGVRKQVGTTVTVELNNCQIE